MNLQGRGHPRASLGLGGLGRAVIPSLLLAVSAGARSPAPSLQALVEAARPGQVVQLPSGTYYGPVVIDRPLTLSGAGNAVIDGRGGCSVVTINAEGVTLRHLRIQGSGDAPDRDNAGVVLNAGRARIEDCTIRDVLYGIYATSASASIIRGNTIQGKPYELGRRGDGIRLWECSRCVVAGNSIRGCRDVVVWYSNQVMLRRNRFEGNRYGLHFMFSDHCEVEENRIERNSVGIYLMYSKALVLRRNVLAANRGPSGFGLGLKDVDGVEASGNLIVGNRIGIFFDDSPSRDDIRPRFVENTLAYNDIGLAFLPSVKHNGFSGNGFIDNVEQIGILGEGGFRGNSFTLSGRGNYWSDYRGYDLNGDGVGDLPFRAEGMFEDLMDRKPALRLFLFSPAQQAIDLAARAFPVFPPRLKAVDTAPLMKPPALFFAADIPSRRIAPLCAAASAMLACGLTVVLLGSRTIGQGARIHGSPRPSS